MTPAMLPSTLPRPTNIRLSSIPRAMSAGWYVLRSSLRLSVCCGGIFALIGTLLIWGMQWLELAPLTLPLIGGFLLVAPVMTAGLIGVSDAVRAGTVPAWQHVVRAWRDASRSLWALALFCVLVFLIWLTDAGTLYSFMVGERSAGLSHILPQSPHALRFHLSAGVTGVVLSAIVFSVTAHAVPLLVAQRATLVGAVVASVRAVFASPLTHGVWALILSVGVIGSLLVPPLFVLSLPLLAYAGHALHRDVFPPP